MEAVATAKRSNGNETALEVDGNPRGASESSLRSYRLAFERAKELRGDGDPIAELRERAFDRFSTLGFPSLRMEEWRHTNVAPVARTEYQTAGEAEISVHDIEPLLLSGCRTVVVVNGRLAPGLSMLGGALEVVDLEDELVRGAEDASRLFGRSFSGQEHPFVALNTALFRGGLVLRVAAKAVVEEPLHVLHVTVAEGEHRPIVTYPRALVIAGEQSQATIIETYATLGPGRVFTCPVTEFAAGASSVLRHYRWERESEDAAHLAAQRVDLERAANFSSLSLVTGGGLVRNDLHAALDGEGIECVLNGLYVVAGRQLVDHHMRVEHIKPNCNSHELFKGILDDRSRGVFSGRIYVHKPAQKTDAVQTNRNLLLSTGALVNSNPQLEIFADDVKCTHGSTVGQLDPDAIFYLRTRGIDEAAARSLLTFAFASELVEKITVPALRTEVEEFLYRRLPGGELVRRASA